MPLIWMVSPVGLEEEFFNDITSMFLTAPDDWWVTEGFRSKERSDKLYAAYLKGGPRAAPGGKSPHNIGEAIDVVPDLDKHKAGLQMDWTTSHPSWHWLFDHVKAHPRLHSGVSFGDAPHIESVKFTRNKLRHADGSYYIPVQNLRYLQFAPTNIRMV
jgi:hypothetical protein